LKKQDDMNNEWNGRVMRLNESPLIMEHFGLMLYFAFSHLPQTLLKQIWDIDDERKFTSLKSKADDTFVIPWIVDGNVLAYLAYQENGIGKFSQVEYFGFDLEVVPENSIEVLALFRTNQPLPEGLNLHRDFIDNICATVLINKGCHLAHATCTDKILPLYLRWGFGVFAKRETHGFQRVHIFYKK
jgi:hypothetical protein